MAAHVGVRCVRCEQRARLAAGGRTCDIENILLVRDELSDHINKSKHARDRRERRRVRVDPNPRRSKEGTDGGREVGQEEGRSNTTGYSRSTSPVRRGCCRVFPTIEVRVECFGVRSTRPTRPRQALLQEPLFHLFMVVVEVRGRRE